MTMFNPAPGAEAPFTSNSTETVMMSYGGITPQQALDCIATQAAEIERLRGQLTVTKVTTPTATMEAEFQAYYRRGYAAALAAQPKEPTK